MFVVSAVLFLCASPATATLVSLAQIDASIEGGASLMADKASFGLAYSGLMGTIFYEDTFLFEDILVGMSDVGSTFVASSSSDPDFTRFVSIFTNGTDDGLSFYAGFGGGFSFGEARLESSWLGDQVTEEPDLSGYVIEQITLTVNSLALDSPGTNPNRDGIWTDISADCTFTFYGIPEPSPLILLALGSSPLSRRRG